MKERRLLEQLPNPRQALAMGLLILATACSSPAVVNGVEINPKSACNSQPITEKITDETTAVIIFGKRFQVENDIIKGFDTNLKTGYLVADAGDVNEDGNPDVIEASVVNNQITARLVCGTGQNTGSNK
jgi:hypothetical protein